MKSQAHRSVQSLGSRPRVRSITERLLTELDWQKKEKQWFDADGRTDIQRISNDLSISAPAVKTLLEKKYGSRMQYLRGRFGGTFLTPSGRVNRVSSKAATSSDNGHANGNRQRTATVYADKAQRIRIPGSAENHRFVIELVINPTMFAAPASAAQPVSVEIVPAAVEPSAAETVLI